MLLEFKIKNYKSFVEETVFSMFPAPKQKDLEYSILKEKVGGNEYKALSSAVIYGPNASGKSNLLGAMDTLKEIILRGNIRNGKEKAANYASSALELIPNFMLKKNEPVYFSIKFIEQNILFEYKLVIDLNVFLERFEERRIINEILYVNNIEVFERGETVKLGKDLLKLRNFIKPNVYKSPEAANDFIKNSLNESELFLSNGFKSIISQEIFQIINNWLEQKFITIFDSIKYESKLSPDSFGFKEKFVYINKDIDKAAASLGTVNHIGYIRDSKDEMILSSIFNKNDGKGGTIVPAKLIESLGTLRFINLLYPLMAVLKSGGTLVVDEFDTSLHPMVVMNIINIFHNDEINKNKAQLIFNTHNPIFLNASLYRRDEIKFVERDDKGFSTHYSLSDIVYPDEKRVRKGADYMSNYFINRYGAIKDIDLSPLFEEVVGKPDVEILCRGRKPCKKS